MKMIRRYPVPIGVFEHQMPVGSRVLSARVSSNEIKVSALIDPDAPLKTRRFHVVACGQELPDAVQEMAFVGPAVLESMEWHVFYEWVDA